MRIFKNIDSTDIRILTAIELGMQKHEWVPLEHILKFTKISIEKLNYKLNWLTKNDLVRKTQTPYDACQIYFEGYDALALNTLVKRNTINALGSEIGVGKESIVHEAICEPEFCIGDPTPSVIKFHREGMTSFKQVKRNRGHLAGKEHFSWIYAARLSATREYNIMCTIYPEIDVPRPIDHNRHAIVMELVDGKPLFKTKLTNPENILNIILSQIKRLHQMGIIHSDISEYNIFLSEKGIKIIDWPQYVTCDHPHAFELLERDVSNILTYFSRKYKIKTNLKDLINYIVNENNDRGNEQ
ncbi:RIO kinase 2 [Methanosalsum natronophilum]|nr:RIO kinase 2 [Methanosalsum natronophilum]